MVAASQDVENIVETRKRSMSKRKGTVSDDDKALFQLQESAKVSGNILAVLQSKLAAPLSEVDVFASHIQATLRAMSKCNFRRARKAINVVLVPFLNQSSSNDDALLFSSTLPEISRRVPLPDQQLLQQQPPPPLQPHQLVLKKKKIQSVIVFVC